MLQQPFASSNDKFECTKSNFRPNNLLLLVDIWIEPKIIKGIKMNKDFFSCPQLAKFRILWAIVTIILFFFQLQSNGCMFS